MQAMPLAFASLRSDIGRERDAMTTDGQRKTFATLLALLGLILFGIAKFAPLPHRPTPASLFLMGVGACLLFLAARLMPGPKGGGDQSGFVSRWMNGRVVLMFAGILFLLAYGLWAVFTGSL